MYKTRCRTCHSEKLRSSQEIFLDKIFRPHPETEAEISNMRHPQATLDGASCGKLKYTVTMVTAVTVGQCPEVPVP